MSHTHTLIEVDLTSSRAMAHLLMLHSSQQNQGWVSIGELMRCCGLSMSEAVNELKAFYQVCQLEYIPGNGLIFNRYRINPQARFSLPKNAAHTKVQVLGLQLESDLGGPGTAAHVDPLDDVSAQHPKRQAIQAQQKATRPQKKKVQSSQKDSTMTAAPGTRLQVAKGSGKAPSKVPSIKPGKKAQGASSKEASEPKQAKKTLDAKKVKHNAPTSNGLSKKTPSGMGARSATKPSASPTLKIRKEAEVRPAGKGVNVGSVKRVTTKAQGAKKAGLAQAT